MNAKDLLLDDALATAIRSERKIIKLKRIVAILIGIIIALIILLIGG